MDKFWIFTKKDINKYGKVSNQYFIHNLIPTMKSKINNCVSIAVPPITSPVTPSIFLSDTNLTKKAVKKQMNNEIRYFNLLKNRKGVENSIPINGQSLQGGKRMAPRPVLFAGFEIFNKIVIEYLAKTDAYTKSIGSKMEKAL